MSRKRALSASPSPTPELDLQHRNKVPKTDIPQGKPLDPVYHLNGDILNMVFDRLPIADVFSCASLNKAWEAVALRWMHQTRSLVGQKLRCMCYEAVPVAMWQELSIAEIKYYASNLSRAQSAKATSLFSCHGPVGFVDVGDFAANLSRGDPNYSNFHSVLHWRPLHPSNNSQHQSKTYEIPETSERFGRGTVIALFVNRNGVIMVNLQYLGAQTNRLLVYCPIDEKRLWDYPYNSHITCPNSPSVIVPVPFGPVALGQSYAYCVSTEAHSGWALMAYDFRTGKEVYRISKGVQWFRSANTWLAEGRPVPERLVRLVEVNGEELLVLMSEPRLTETTVEIIRGRDGQPVYSIEYSPFWKLSCLADSLTNQVALMWYKPAERAANAGRSITLIRTFSYQPGQPFTLSPLIAVERKTPCSEYETLQPFTMTDIEVVTLASEKRGKFTISRSCLIQVGSQRIRNLALQAAIDLFDHAPRHIRCYTTDSPRTVTVSESGSSLPPGSQNSDILAVDTVPTPAVYWLDHARLVIQTMNYTRIVQF